MKLLVVFFFNDTATTEIYTLSLHDALPISSSVHPPVKTDRRLKSCPSSSSSSSSLHRIVARSVRCRDGMSRDRKSTRLNSSHANISYAVFCLKKKKKNTSYLY